MNTTPQNYWVNKVDFRDKYPLFIIDMSHKHENIKDVAINVRVTFTFKNRAPENISLHGILVNDAYFAYSPGSNRT